MITCQAALLEKLAFGWQVKRLHSKCFHIECHSQCLNSVFWSFAPQGLRWDLYEHSDANCKTDVSISFYVGVNCATLCFYWDAFLLMEMILEITHARGNGKTDLLFLGKYIFILQQLFFSQCSTFGLAMNIPVFFHPWLLKWE